VTILDYALGVLVAGALMLMWGMSIAYQRIANWDREFTAWAYRPNQRAAWRLFSRMGDGWVYVAYFFWLRFWGEPTKQLAETVFLAWGLGAAVKLTIRRPRHLKSWHRPRTAAKRFHNRVVGRVRELSYSFPSQHAACAVAFACSTWPNPTGIVFAGLVCVSRVLIGAHYVSDVLAGVGVGLLAWRLA